MGRMAIDPEERVVEPLGCGYEPMGDFVETRQKGTYFLSDGVYINLHLWY
ncbi:MAG TPA: hypothetical protein VMV04_07495 [Thermodesulfobacteriota bacterium]|jgi:hypothetical protein|nr:hypothetical protein [Thermodesulfobacteriota bacterium]